jgi:ribonuclease VapC
VNSAGVVADTSAVIALLVGERFTRFEPARLANTSISAVNLSEVLTWLQEIGMPENVAARALGTLNLGVIAFDEPLAWATARLRPFTRHAGLSLGDRACLALGNSFRCPVVTADRIWASLDVGVEIALIR